MAGKSSRPIVTLTTDFGSSSPYVAQMKGVLLSRNPNLQLIDITHDVPPQDIRSGALVLDDVCPRFPPHTIHVAVVDPGVGTDRQVIFAAIGEQQFLAPDNGLLTLLARRSPPKLIMAVTNQLYFLPEVSRTFHGRDIIAPVAAHLSLGLNPQRLGKPLDALVLLTIADPTVESQRIRGEVLQVDRFGNVITNITADHLRLTNRSSDIRVHCLRREVDEIVETYGRREKGSLIALVNSSGRLEIAIVDGHAANALGANIGDEVVVEW